MKTHILMIAEDKNELTIFMAALRKVRHGDGFKCTYASDTAQAIEMLKYLVPDYIFTDFSIHEINGADLFAYIKNQQRLEKTQLCLYSNIIDEKAQGQADAIGAYCLQKADTADELVNNLSIFFNRRSQPDYSIHNY